MSAEHKLTELLAAPSPETDKDLILSMSLQARHFENLVTLISCDGERNVLQFIEGWAKTAQSGQSKVWNDLGLLKLEPRDLPLIYARTQNEQVEPTPIARLLAEVGFYFPIHFIGIDGYALEAIGKRGVKPIDNIRERPHSVSFRAGLPDSKIISPPLGDLDLAIISHNPNLVLEEIYKFLKETIVKNFLDIKLQADLVPSTRRPGFKKIEINLADKPICQMAFPIDLFGKCTAANRLIELVLARSDIVANPVLLCPTGRGAEFDGVAIDFLGGRRKRTSEYIRVSPSTEPSVTLKRKHSVSRLYNHSRGRRTTITQRYRTATYYFPWLAYPPTCWPESFARLTYDIRTFTWARLIPEIINSQIELSTSGSYDSHLRSSRWIHDNVVLPVFERPELLGTAEQRFSSSIALIESLRNAFNGDPLLSSLLFLPKDVVAQTGYDKSLRIPSIEIFSSDGLMGGAYSQLLGREDKFGKPLATGLLRKMETTPLGGEEQRGWGEFINHLFQELSPTQMRALFTPTICPPDMSDRFAQEILSKFDKRFTIQLLHTKSPLP